MSPFIWHHCKAVDSFPCALLPTRVCTYIRNQQNKEKQPENKTYNKHCPPPHLQSTPNPNYQQPWLWAPVSRFCGYDHPLHLQTQKVLISLGHIATILFHSKMPQCICCAGFVVSWGVTLTLLYKWLLFLVYDFRLQLQTDLSFSRGVKWSSVLSEVWDLSWQLKKISHKKCFTIQTALMCCLLYEESALWLETNGCKRVGNCLKSVHVGQCSTEPEGCPGVTAPSQAGGQGEMLEQLGNVLLSAFS